MKYLNKISEQFTTNDSAVAVGSYEIQSYAVNNTWFGENIRYNGTAFSLRAAGKATLFQFNSGGMSIFNFASGVANDTPSPVLALDISTSGAVTIPTLFNSGFGGWIKSDSSGVLGVANPTYAGIENYSSTTGTVSTSDSIGGAIGKLNGNLAAGDAANATAILVVDNNALLYAMMF